MLKKWNDLRSSTFSFSILGGKQGPTHRWMVERIKFILKLSFLLTLRINETTSTMSNYLFSVGLYFKEEILLDLFENATMAATEKIWSSQKKQNKLNLRKNLFLQEIFQNILLICAKKSTANIPWELYLVNPGGEAIFYRIFSYGIKKGVYKANQRFYFHNSTIINFYTLLSCEFKHLKSKMK